MKLGVSQSVHKVLNIDMFPTQARKLQNKTTFSLNPSKFTKTEKKTKDAKQNLKIIESPQQGKR